MLDSKQSAVCFQTWLQLYITGTPQWRSQHQNRKINDSRPFQPLSVRKWKQMTACFLVAPPHYHLFIFPSSWQSAVCIPLSNSKCWTCDSIRASFPVVSALLNHLLTQIWSQLDSTADLESWPVTPQNTEGMIYHFALWQEIEWFIITDSFTVFFLSLLSSFERSCHLKPDW